MIISVASGKGGTGKTLVATSLALSLKEEHDIQFLDCDVEEPNAHIFMKPVFTYNQKVVIPVPGVDEEKCNHCGKCGEVCAFNAVAVTSHKVLVFPELCHGCGACDYLCPQNAITEVANEIGILEVGVAGGVDFVQGKLTIGQVMAPPIIRAVRDFADSNMDTIIDAPPGTSCPVVESIRNSDFCLLVTEPTPFGLNDLALAVATVRQLDISCGVVLNRVGVGGGAIEEYCRKEGIPIMLTIPLDNTIASLYSRGIPLVAGIPDYKSSFIELYEKILGVVNEGSSNSKR